MKLYINAENQLPVFATSISTSATAEEGVLKVYEQGSSGTISSFIFKRDTTVPLDITVAGNDLSVDDVKNLTFGIKLKGKYDDALVVKAEAASGEKTSEGIHFTLSATFNSSVIDEALKANGDSSDDIESADFIAAVSWENSSGEVTESATVDVEIRNNVVREGDIIAGEGTPSGVQWTALAVVKLPYADYVALCEAGEDREDVLYICSDAPSPTAEVESEIESVKESVSDLEESVSNLEDRVSDCETDYEAIEAKVDAISDVDLSDYAKLSGADFTGTLSVGGVEVATKNDLKDADLTGYAKLNTEQTWTAEQTFDANIAIEKGRYIRFATTGSNSIHVGLHGESGEASDNNSGYLYLDKYWAGITETPSKSVKIATEEDIADFAKTSDLDGYAKLAEAQTWTASQNFTGGITKNGVELATLDDIKDVDLSDYAKLSGADFTGTVTVGGVEVATKNDIKDVDLSDYAKLSGADFTGTLSVKGVEVATKDDLKDVDLDGYATEDWVKEYHDKDIESLKEWVTEELSKLDAATQAAEIEEMQEKIDELESEIYAAKLTISIPEDDYEFRLSDFMEGSSASNDYTGGVVPAYDFSVDWGDDSRSESFTNDNWEDAVHSYEKAGSYTVKVKGTFEYIGRKGYSDSDEKLATSNLLTELWLPN